MRGKPIFFKNYVIQYDSFFCQIKSYGTRVKFYYIFFVVIHQGESSEFIDTVCNKEIEFAILKLFVHFM